MRRERNGQSFSFYFHAIWGCFCEGWGIYMSNFTYATWQEFVAELQESHDKHNCSTRDPIWMVQELQRTYGIDSEYSDKSHWIMDGEGNYETAQCLFESLDADERHDINAYVLKESKILFDDLDGDESSQDDLLEGYARSKELNWEKIYYVENWVNVHVFATRHDADRFIKRQGYNYKELRVYVESLWRSPQLCDLMQAILDGELKLVKAGESV